MWLQTSLDRHTHNPCSWADSLQLPFTPPQFLFNSPSAPSPSLLLPCLPMKIPLKIPASQRRLMVSGGGSGIRCCFPPGTLVLKADDKGVGRKARRTSTKGRHLSCLKTRLRCTTIRPRTLLPPPPKRTNPLASPQPVSADQPDIREEDLFDMSTPEYGGNDPISAYSVLEAVNLVSSTPQINAPRVQPGLMQIPEAQERPTRTKN